MATDLVCFSHLRWDFVIQRPHHLMRRAAHDRRVYYVEEAQPAADAIQDRLAAARRDGLTVLTPELAGPFDDVDRRVVALLETYFAREGVDHPVHWLETPMAVPWSEGLDRSLVVFDSMDDLSGFVGAPAGLRERETRVLETADLVITGGVSLQARIADRRPDALCLPSSVDTAHFARATRTPSPPDVTELPRPRFGYVGVIDERIDMTLIRALASDPGTGSVVLVGPIAKIDPASIPDHDRVHHLGARPYDDLPAYLGSFDVGIMPFALDRATRFISPTKTPEYLAAGLPVASTGIADVRSPYGRLGLVEIGDGAVGFVDACRRALATDLETHRGFARDFLRPRSWDETWSTIDRNLRRLETQATPVLVRPTIEAAPAGAR